jgi:endonuclease/exonuclease/phosphatase (EEP) superfamily protein YafD
MAPALSGDECRSWADHPVMLARTLHHHGTAPAHPSRPAAPGLVTPEGKDFLPQGSGWARASALRVETEIAGRTFALYSLHLPGYAHHKKPRTSPEAWERSKHKSLADKINAEDASLDVIVGGDFNEWTDDLVMRSLLQATKLENAVTERSIDHILYSTARPIKLLDIQRDWGPKNQNAQNVKSDGCLSDHPWIYCEFEL